MRSVRFDEKLKTESKESVWAEYCSFLDLSIDEYMQIQYRLLLEQIDVMSKCGLGQKLFGGVVPSSVEEFRNKVPLTTYHDYADILLLKRENMLPEKPVLWLKTTWEGGEYPAKTAPYSENMLQTYKNNVIAAMILSVSKGKGRFFIKSGTRVLYSLAPLPYATGLFPELIDSEIKFNFMPSLKEAKKLSFTQQNKKGFQLCMKHGMDMFFGMSSVVYRISKNLQDMSSDSSNNLKSLLKMSPRMAVRMLAALYRSRRDGVPIRPKDLFKLDGFVCGGADTTLYKDELEELWGIRPTEMATGTETSCLAAETWSKNGLVFFPDNCFYEFIPEAEMMRNLSNPEYVPRTYLMNELTAGEKYELVLTVLKGGAFMRYRLGDIYRCIRLKNPQDQIDFPQFEYVDRVPNVIDVAGFTRITAQEIEKVIEYSRLEISDWFATKEYGENGRSYLHMYVELLPEALKSKAVSKKILKEHLSIYFRYYDGDYEDLKRLLGIDPLEVTILKSGTIEAFKQTGRRIPKINPSKQEVLDLLRLLGGSGEGDDG